MNLKVEKWTIDDDINYKILELEKCCDKLINSKNIDLYADYYDDYDYSVNLIREERDYDEYSEFDYEKIKFCPFCGELIIIEIVNEVDKTNEYKILKEERDISWKKCCKTDSKKKEGELRQRVWELDKNINKLLGNDSLDN